MKIIFTLLIFTITAANCFAQDNNKIVYMVVNIWGRYDNDSLRSYFVIDAEKGSRYAAELYALRDYKIAMKRKEPLNFFYSNNDTVTPYLNYFLNTTEALLFLSEHGWRLITVNNVLQTSSGSLITNFSSKNDYYFSKAVD